MLVETRTFLLLTALTYFLEPGTDTGYLLLIARWLPCPSLYPFDRCT